LSTKITNNSSANHLAKLGLGVPSGSAKPQLGLWMGCSLLDFTLPALDFELVPRLLLQLYFL